VKHKPCPPPFLEHRDLRKEKTVGDWPSLRVDGENPSPTPHGVLTDGLSSEKQHISGTELEMSS